MFLDSLSFDKDSRCDGSNGDGSASLHVDSSTNPHDVLMLRGSDSPTLLALEAAE